MTNDELKKKIVEILCKVWIEPVPCTAERKFEHAADALIAAGIGDVKRHRVFVSKDGKEVKQFYSGEEVENIVKERNELKVELRDKVDYIHEQDEVIKEYKHCAARAERALLYAVSEYRCDECPCEECNAEIRGSNECIDLIIKTYKSEPKKNSRRKGNENQRA